MNDHPEWFGAKRYGYGAGWPITWKGWAVLGVYLAITIITGYIFEDRPPIAFAIVVPVTLLLLVIAAKTTRGGWRWRWGEPD